MKKGMKTKRRAAARQHCANYTAEGGCLGVPASCLFDHGQKVWVANERDACAYADTGECLYFRQVVRP